MLPAENECRIPLALRAGGVHPTRWSTDLDLFALQRAGAFLGTDDEERGPWLDADGGPVQSVVT